jgi:hypothetical protein
VVFADNRVQVVARGTDNKLYAQKETASGFTGWTDIGDSLTFKGSAAGTEQRIFYIDANGNYDLLQTAAYMSDSSARAGARGTSNTKAVRQEAITGQVK